MNTEPHSFLSFLKRLINRKKCSTNRFAANLGVSHTTVGRWLSGALLPNTESCRKIAEYSGESLQRILSIAGHLPPIVETGTHEWPEFREYIQMKYPEELDEDWVVMIEDLIERRRSRKSNGSVGKS